ncbi:hypothetical protein HYG86_15995 [Alkalicella caledoniensis]|uniref:Uncharacterized protein n=1 Tax=Alkalicella caledoniensis TaxID=2731377 RepID=A0A7G9WBV4_ALKCA|nr:hypothetical protein [Alkalicella caledoniensis]QNO16166.1 hypothetical protein HYG86_15995 [Alkalicella caledoniensis]
MLRTIDKVLLLILALGTLYYYITTKISQYKVKKFIKSGKTADKRIVSGLEKQGYSIVNISPAKRIQYFKEGMTQEEYTEPKLVVKHNGKKYVVERYSGSQTVSLRDYQTKLKIITNMVCYNIKGVLFIDNKGDNIRECSIKISHEYIFVKLVNKIIILSVFVLIGFYMSRFM